MPNWPASKKGQKELWIPLFAPEWMIRFSNTAAKAKRYNPALDDLALSDYTKRMARKSRKGGASGTTLVELTVVITVIGILACLGYTSLESYNRIQRGISAGNDLREIYLAQKKAIVLGLNNPTTLDYPGAWTQVPALVANKFLPATATAAYPTTSYDCSTIPPTHNLDGPAGNNDPKILGKAHTGDGLYDIGPEN